MSTTTTESAPPVVTVEHGWITIEPSALFPYAVTLGLTHTGPYIGIKPERPFTGEPGAEHFDEDGRPFLEVELCSESIYSHANLTKARTAACRDILDGFRAAGLAPEFVDHEDGRSEIRVPLADGTAIRMHDEYERVPLDPNDFNGWVVVHQGPDHSGEDIEFFRANYTFPRDLLMVAAVLGYIDALAKDAGLV